MFYSRTAIFRRLLALALAALFLPPLAVLAQAPPEGSGFEYCVASRAVVPQNQFDGFRVDYLMQQPRDLRVDLYAAQSPETSLRSWGIPYKDSLPHLFRWDGKISRQPAPVGDYILRFQQKGGTPVDMAVTVAASQEPLPLTLTEERLFLPQGVDDDSVWTAMTAPVAVVDAGPLTHHALLSTADGRGKKVGEVHGQTVGLVVKKLDVNGYALVGAWATDDGSYVEGYIPQRKLMMVQPDTRYGLLLDKNAQTMTVYQDGHKVGTMPVSTGLMAKQRLLRETRAGAFLTESRARTFDSEGFRYDYAIRIDGGNLIHQLGYKTRGGADFSEQQPQLGQKASHGCVRLPYEPTAEGLNALWLWQRLPYQTKVLVLDDPAARLVQYQQLFPTPTPSPVPTPAPTPVITQIPAAVVPADAGMQAVPPEGTSQPVFPTVQGSTPLPDPTAVPQLAPGSSGKEVSRMQQRLQDLGYFQHKVTGHYLQITQEALKDFQAVQGLPADGVGHAQTMDVLYSEQALLKPTPAPTPVPPAEAGITLTFLGDCVLGSEEQSRSLPNSFDSVVAEKGMDWPFSGLAELLRADDLTSVNFEGVLKEDAAKRQPTKIHNFRGPMHFAQVLVEGSVELAGLANNHVYDYAQEGRNSTRQALRDHGIAYYGYGDDYLYEKDGIRIGFAGLRETTFHQDRSRIASEIRALKKQGCHYIVYACHFGTEYEANHNDIQTAMARAAIDAGADLVVGTHPHVVQGVERYKQGFIAYSIGNGVFGGNLDMTVFDALALRVELQFSHQQLTQTAVTLVPILTSGDAPRNDFRPVIAKGADKDRILATVQADSPGFTVQERMVFTPGTEEGALPAGDGTQPEDQAPKDL
ncbi:MAG: L,D-transpeptidase family protein [Clostridiales bacterium]|nr:L,D-transpeptidase family protein [Clostridiales bacterium]